MQRVKKGKRQMIAMENSTFAAILAVVLVFGILAGCASAPSDGAASDKGASPAASAPKAPDVKKTEPAAMPPATPSATPPAADKAAEPAPPAEVKNDNVYEVAFKATRLGESDDIKMGSFGRLALTPKEGNNFVAYQLDMSNGGTMDKKITISKPQLIAGGKKYAYSYQKTHEASLSTFLPYVCDFKMDGASDAGFSAKARSGYTRNACLVFEVLNQTAAESLVFDVTVEDSDKAEKGSVSIGLSAS